MSDDAAPDGTGYRWTPTRVRAAELVADDAETDEAIARQVGIGKRTLERWKSQPAFAARVAERREAQRRAIEAEGIADKRNRMAAYNDRWERLRRVIEERAAEMDGEIAGAGTGLLVRQAKVVKVIDVAGVDVAGGVPEKRVEIVHEYAVDTGMLAELRQTEKQAAQEMGQWVDKVAPTDDQGKALDLATLMQRARDARAGREGDAGGDGRAQ